MNLVGDAAETLKLLLRRLEQKSAGEWRKTIADGIQQWWKDLDDCAHQPASPVNPQLVTWELSPRVNFVTALVKGDPDEVSVPHRFCPAGIEAMSGLDLTKNCRLRSAA